LEGEVEPLTLYAVSGILHRGGTILGTSRKNPTKSQDDKERVLNNLRRYGIGALVVVGGNDTLSAALYFYREGIPIVGIPKTIDNDILGTDFTFGFNTAVSVVTEAIDRLHTTAESHNRIMVVEVMGRHSGWIAVMAGIAGGADMILIPEVPYDIDKICDVLKKRHELKRFSIVVVAEGAKPAGTDRHFVIDSKVDEFGNVRLGGIGTVIGEQIEDKTGIETRVTILGHVQRGGSPTPYDRILATRFGVAGVDALMRKEYGKMVALRSENIITIPIEEAVLENKMVDMELYEMASIFFG
jgi:6-phosphofructokinase 1